MHIRNESDKPGARCKAERGDGELGDSAEGWVISKVMAPKVHGQGVRVEEFEPLRPLN